MVTNVYCLSYEYSHQGTASKTCCKLCKMLLDEDFVALPISAESLFKSDYHINKKGGFEGSIHVHSGCGWIFNIIKFGDFKSYEEMKRWIQAEKKRKGK